MDQRTKIVWSLLAGIALIAITLRFYYIHDYPPGISAYEAVFGVTAVRIIQGALPVIFVQNGSFDLLYPLIMVPAIASFGVGFWQMHAVSAVIGVVTVIAMYFATRPWFGKLSGLLAALFVATSTWHVTASRTSGPEILLPLLFSLLIAGIGYSLIFTQKKKMRAAYVMSAMAGTMFTTSLYISLSGLVVLVVLLGLALLLLLSALHPKVELTLLEKYWRHLVIALTTAIILSAPLLWSVFAQPDSIRQSITMVESAPDFLTNIRTIIFTLFTGLDDLSWHSGVAGFPLLNPLVGLLTILGVAWSIGWLAIVFRKMVRGIDLHLGMIFPYLILTLLGWLAIIAINPDQLVRGHLLISLLVPLYMLAGTAGAVCIRWLRKIARTDVMASITAGSLIGIIILFGLYDVSLYFLLARVNADAASDYRADLVSVARYLNDLPQPVESASNPYLVIEPDAIPIIEFLLSATQTRVQQLNPATVHLTKFEPGTLIVFSSSTLDMADRLTNLQQDLELLTVKHDQFNREEFRVYRIPVTIPPIPADVTSDLDA